MRRSLATFLTSALFCAALCPSASAQVHQSRRAQLPTLLSNRLDYGPGETAYLTGSGFVPNELVALRVVHADGSPSSGAGHDPWTVAADGVGRFFTTWHVCEDDCIGEVLLATARGVRSGVVAQASFTDNHECGTGVVTSVTPVGGSCSDFTPAVGAGPDNYEVEEGGSYVMTIEGVTECSGDTITVFVQSSSVGNFCFDATGGSGTYVGSFTMPDPACNTMPVSYKCGAGATCNHPDSLAAQGPTSGCGGVHLRTSTFDGSCNRTGDDTECNGPTPSGACCLVDGTCVEVTEANCLAMGGTYSGDDTECAQVTCPQPAGACCLDDGSCVQVTEEDCLAMGGTYSGDLTLCMDVSCPQPPGACCLVDGTCVEVTEEDCLAMGGTYSGDFSLCMDVTCPQPAGACCLVDGTCVQVTEVDCLAMGGLYHGDLSLCMDVICESPVGACCLVDGTCVEVTEEDCLAAGGTYSGDFTLCVDEDCPQPAGACCLADGSCVQVTEEDCLAAGGTFYGDFSLCMDVACPQPPGACCLVDGTCVEVTEEDCLAMGGIYYGDFSLCEDVICMQPLDCFDLNFDTDDNGNGMAHGAIVDAEFDCNGPVFPVRITGTVNFSGSNTAAILNSTTGPASQDPDLLVGRGNILILQTDANLNQCPPGSGVYCSHNDDENGGRLRFDFCLPASPSRITLIDIDGGDLTSNVVLTDANGKTRTYTVPGNWTGDRVTNAPEPGWQVLDLTNMAPQPGFASVATASQQAGYDPTAVVRIDVNLGGSGGVDDLSWCQ